jgi:hypothetical protein
MQYLLTQEELDTLSRKYVEQVEKLKTEVSQAILRTRKAYGMAGVRFNYLHSPEYSLVTGLRDALRKFDFIKLEKRNEPGK